MTKNKVLGGNIKTVILHHSLFAESKMVDALCKDIIGSYKRNNYVIPSELNLGKFNKWKSSTKSLLKSLFEEKILASSKESLQTLLSGTGDLLLTKDKKAHASVPTYMVLLPEEKIRRFCDLKRIYSEPILNRDIYVPNTMWKQLTVITNTIKQSYPLNKEVSRYKRKYFYVITVPQSASGITLEFRHEKFGIKKLNLSQDMIKKHPAFQLHQSAHAMKLAPFVAKAKKSAKKGVFVLLENREGRKGSPQKKTPKKLRDFVKANCGQLTINGEGNNTYILESQIGTGGEGTVYTLSNDPENVAKIYKKTSGFLESKLEKMVSNSALKNEKTIIYPQELLYFNGRFVGYKMKKATGKPLDITLRVLKQEHQNWKRSDLLRVAHNYLKIVYQIHTYNLVLADINPGNILWNDQSRLLEIVDMDSSQVEDFPCTVGVDDYLSPSAIQKRKEGVNNWLRSKNDDLFSVSIFIFQILMAGAHPYNHRGMDSTQEKNIVGHFVYPYKQQGDGSKIPGKSYFPLWQLLNNKMKELFVKVFRKKERLTINQLIDAVDSYKNYLKKHPEKDILHNLSS